MKLPELPALPINDPAAAHKVMYDYGKACAKAAQPQWQPPETAPKDGTVFLGNFGYPWPMPAVWNGPSNKYCAAELHADLYHGKWNDTYFQNEHLDAKELIGWMPLPEIPTKEI